MQVCNSTTSLSSLDPIRSGPNKLNKFYNQIRKNHIWTKKRKYTRRMKKSTNSVRSKRSIRSVRQKEESVLESGDDYLGRVNSTKQKRWSVGERSFPACLSGSFSSASSSSSTSYSKKVYCFEEENSLKSKIVCRKGRKRPNEDDFLIQLEKTGMGMGDEIGQDQENEVNDEIDESDGNIQKSNAKMDELIVGKRRKRKFPSVGPELDCLLDSEDKVSSVSSGDSNGFGQRPVQSDGVYDYFGKMNTENLPNSKHLGLDELMWCR